MRPGGVLAIVGLARGGTPADFARARPAFGGSLLHRLAGRLLPGVRYRRHLYLRYSLVWTKPGVTPGPARPR